jgi:hypothetical protein
VLPSVAKVIRDHAVRVMRQAAELERVAEEHE